MSVNHHEAIVYLEIADLLIEVASGKSSDAPFLKCLEWGRVCKPELFFSHKIHKPHLRVSFNYGMFANDPGSILYDFKQGDSWHIQDSHLVFQSSLPWQAEFNFEFSSCLVRAGADYPSNTFWFDFIVRQLLLNYIAQNGLGACLHSCGLVDSDGNGYLFLGHSGVGKSTTARLWAAEVGVKVLSDEITIVRRKAGQLRLYGTPWHSSAQQAQPGSAPLRAIFFLQHGPRNEVKLLSNAVAVANLFTCSYPTHHNPTGINNTLKFLEEMVALTPHYQLSFVPDSSVVEFVRDLMKQEHGRERLPNYNP